MSSPFVAEIRAFGFSFAPTGWAQCDGQLMPISQNTALFSLLGTFYGGDGKSTFALPNLQGNISIGQGQGGGLSDYFLGQNGGSANVTLLNSEMPNHVHNVKAANLFGDSLVPNQAALSKGTKMYTALTAHLVNLDFNAISVAGGSLPHNNMMPYLCLNFCIALQGVFPARP